MRPWISSLSADVDPLLVRDEHLTKDGMESVSKMPFSMSLLWLAQIPLLTFSCFKVFPFFSMGPLRK